MSFAPTLSGTAHKLGAFSLAFGGLAAWSSLSESSVIVTPVNTSFATAPASIAFGGIPQFTLSRVQDPNFGPKNYITTLGGNLYTQQTLAGKVITNQPDPIPGNVSLKFVAAPTATDLLSVPRDVAFFVPLEVVKGANHNFGYAELGTFNGGATLVSYAFETVSGRSLIATPLSGSGQGSPSVPEPASLAMSALGAVGVLAARRRGAAKTA